MTGTQIAAALVTAASLAAIAPHGAPHNNSGPAGHTGNLFPAPTEALSIVAQGDGAHSLYDLLKQLNILTEQNFTMSAQTRSTLEGTSPGLLTDIVVPPNEVHSFVSTLLYRHGFFVAELKHSQPSLLGVYSGNDRQFSWTRVPAEDVPRYSQYPAFLIETVVTLEHLDVRQMTTSLRALLGNNQTQAMLNVGSSNSVVLRGTGAGVTRLVEILQEANTANGELLRMRAEADAELRQAHACQHCQEPAGRQGQTRQAD